MLTAKATPKAAMRSKLLKTKIKGKTEAAAATV